MKKHDTEKIFEILNCKRCVFVQYNGLNSAILHFKIHNSHAVLTKTWSGWWGMHPVIPLDPPL